MSEFSHRDRAMIEAESLMWAVRTMLMDAEAGAWNGRIQDIRREAEKIAKELREYNDQFEVLED